MGRKGEKYTIVPTVEDEKVMLAALCDIVEAGGSLVGAVKRYNEIVGRDVPYYSVVSMFSRHPDYKQRLHQSRCERSHAAIDRAYKAVEDMENRQLDSMTGTAVINGLLKLAAKDNPTRYGERVDMTVNHGFSMMTDAQFVAKLAEMTGSLPSIAAVIDADEWTEDESDK